MSEISSFEIEILQLINQHRNNLQLSPLAFHAPIQKASYNHSKNIAQGVVPFGHSGFSDRANLLVQLLNGTAASENVAMGQRTPSEVVKSWLDSTGHRKNIEGDFNLTGISVVKTLQGENVFTQIFIKAPAPTIKTNDNLSPANINNDKSALEINLNYSILKLVNKHRAAQYLSTLQINPHIQVMATQHAQDMANESISFGHNNFQDRARTLLSKLRGTSAAENVALGDKDANTIVKSWLNSSGHRNNIEGEFNLTGIGIAQGKNQQMYYCQIFIKK